MVGIVVQTLQESTIYSTDCDATRIEREGMGNRAASRLK